jgi:hypothetical protein
MTTTTTAPQHQQGTAVTSTSRKSSKQPKPSCRGCRSTSYTLVAGVCHKPRCQAAALPLTTTPEPTRTPTTESQPVAQSTAPQVAAPVPVPVTTAPTPQPVVPNTPSTPKQCSAHKVDGTRCQSQIVQASGMCREHETQSELSRLRAHVSQLESTNAVLRSRVSQLETERAELEGEVLRLDSELRMTEKALERCESRLEALTPTTPPLSPDAVDVVTECDLTEDVAALTPEPDAHTLVRCQGCGDLYEYQELLDGTCCPCIETTKQAVERATITVVQVLNVLWAQPLYQEATPEEQLVLEADALDVVLNDGLSLVDYVGSMDGFATAASYLAEGWTHEDGVWSNGRRHVCVS